MFKRQPTATVKETVRTGQRDIAKAVRGLEKESRDLKRQEALLRRDIKADLKRGNQATARQKAKSLVRLQAQQAKLQAGRDGINTVGTSLRVQQTTAASAAAMAVAGSAMQAMNQTANPESMLRDAQAFSRENARMDMAGEMVGDALDDAFSDDEEEADSAVAQVMEEIGIDLSAQLGAHAAPRARVAGRAAAPPAAAAAADEDAELREMLASLK